MSKKFFVLYSMKEFIVPRIFKTRATINKYLEENRNLQFKQFKDEEQAQKFTKAIERNLEDKYKINMIEAIDKSHIDIESINKNDQIKKRIGIEINGEIKIEYKSKPNKDSKEIQQPKNKRVQNITLPIQNQYDKNVNQNKKLNEKKESQGEDIGQEEITISEKKMKGKNLGRIIEGVQKQLMKQIQKGYRKKQKYNISKQEKEKIENKIQQVKLKQLKKEEDNMSGIFDKKANNDQVRRNNQFEVDQNKKNKEQEKNNVKQVQVKEVQKQQVIIQEKVDKMKKFRKEKQQLKRKQQQQLKRKEQQQLKRRQQQQLNGKQQQQLKRKEQQQFKRKQQQQLKRKEQQQLKRKQQQLLKRKEQQYLKRKQQQKLKRKQQQQLKRRQQQQQQLQRKEQQQHKRKQQQQLKRKEQQQLKRKEQQQLKRKEQQQFKRKQQQQLKRKEQQQFKRKQQQQLKRKEQQQLKRKEQQQLKRRQQQQLKRKEQQQFKRKQQQQLKRKEQQAINSNAILKHKLFSTHQIQFHTIPNRQISQVIPPNSQSYIQSNMTNQILFDQSHNIHHSLTPSFSNPNYHLSPQFDNNTSTYHHAQHSLASHNSAQSDSFLSNSAFTHKSPFTQIPHQSVSQKQTISQSSNNLFHSLFPISNLLSTSFAFSLYPNFLSHLYQFTNFPYLRFVQSYMYHNQSMQSSSSLLSFSITLFSRQNPGLTILVIQSSTQNKLAIDSFPKIIPLGIVNKYTAQKLAFYNFLMFSLPYCKGKQVKISSNFNIESLNYSNNNQLNRIIRELNNNIATLQQNFKKIYYC